MRRDQAMTEVPMFLTAFTTELDALTYGVPDLDVRAAATKSGRSQIVSTWAVALALVAVIGVRSLLPDAPPRLAPVRTVAAVPAGEAAAIASIPPSTVRKRTAAGCPVC